MLELISTYKHFQTILRAFLSISCFKKFNTLILLKKDEYIEKLGEYGKNMKMD